MASISIGRIMVYLYFLLICTTNLNTVKEAVIDQEEKQLNEEGI